MFGDPAVKTENAENLDTDKEMRTLISHQCPISNTTHIFTLDGFLGILLHSVTKGRCH